MWSTDASQWAQQLVAFKAQFANVSQVLQPNGPWSLETKERNIALLLELLESPAMSETMTRDSLDVLRILSREVTGSQLLFRPDVRLFSIVSHRQSI
jgi:hypothetical protein